MALALPLFGILNAVHYSPINDFDGQSPVRKATENTMRDTETSEDCPRFKAFGNLPGLELLSQAPEIESLK